MSKGARHATMRPRLSDAAREELRRRLGAVRSGDDPRGLHDRGTGGNRVGGSRAVDAAVATALHGPPPRPGPEGVALTLAREVTIGLPALSADFLVLKPEFVGNVELRFGATNPQVEILRRPGATTVTVNRAIEEGVEKVIEVTLRDAQFGLLARSVDALGSANGTALALALRAALGTGIARYLRIDKAEIEPLNPPELVSNLRKASVSLYFLRISGKWERVALQTEALGVPVRLVFVGKITLKAGLTAGGWDAVARALASRVTSSGSAAIFKALESQLALRGAVNGLLGLASPAITLVATPVIAGLITYASAAAVEQAREEGERWGLLDQFATGFVQRVFYPRDPQRWLSGSPTGRRRAARIAGIRAAERELRRYSPEVLKQIVYVQLDYAGRHGATEEDIRDRLREELRSGRRSVGAPTGR